VLRTLADAFLLETPSGTARGGRGWLTVEGQGGMRGEGVFTYPPDHADYQMVLDHVSPIKPGETVPVKPWPEGR
jgi:hypothetical protein